MMNPAIRGSFNLCGARGIIFNDPIGKNLAKLK